jgi:hypothetical protein
MPLLLAKQYFCMSASQGSVITPLGLHTKKDMCRLRPSSRLHPSVKLAALATMHFFTAAYSLRWESSVEHSLQTSRMATQEVHRE